MWVAQLQTLMGALTRRGMTSFAGTQEKLAQKIELLEHKLKSKTQSLPTKCTPHPTTPPPPPSPPHKPTPAAPFTTREHPTTPTHPITPQQHLPPSPLHSTIPSNQPQLP